MPAINKRTFESGKQVDYFGIITKISGKKLTKEQNHGRLKMYSKTIFKIDEKEVKRSAHSQRVGSS